MNKYILDKLREAGYDQQANQALRKLLNEAGYSGQLNQALYEYLGDLGYTNTLSERMFAFMLNNGNFLGGLTATVLPVISGTYKVGETLTCSTGTWEGTGTITYSYQWERDGVVISGATSSTYTLVGASDLTTPSCIVTATDDNGSASREATGSQVTYVAPTASSALVDQSFTQDTGVQTYDVSGDFSNAQGGTWSVSGAGATISQSGVVSIPTTALLAGAVVIVTYTNSGGAASSAFSATVTAAAPTGIAFGALTPVGKGATSTTASDGTYGEFDVSGGMMTPNTSPLTVGTATVGSDEVTVVAGTAHLLADEVSATLASLTSVATVKVRDVEDRSIVITIPSGTVFAQPTTLEAEHWTQGATPNLTTSSAKIGRILYYTNATPLENLTIQGFDLNWTTDLGGNSMIHIGRPTINCAVKHNRCIGPDLAVERSSGRLATYTFPRVGGIHLGNDPDNYGTGSHYGILVEDNFVGEVVQGINFQQATNYGTRLATRSRNRIDGFFQRDGILQYLFHNTDYGVSGIFTKSGAPCGVLIENNVSVNVLADALDSSKVGGDPVNLQADRIHAALTGFNQTWDGVKLLGNKYALGPRFDVDFPGNNGTSATGLKFNDPTGAAVYKNIDIAFNIILANGISLEVSGGKDIYLYQNTILADPWIGSSASVYMGGVENLKLFKNVMQIADAITNTIQGIKTADSWMGYGNVKVNSNGAYDDASEFGDVAMASPDWSTYWDEWIPKAGARIDSIAATPGAMGTTGLYTPGSGTDSVVYDPPVSAMTDTASLAGVVFDGTQSFTWSGTYGTFFDPDINEATLAFWVKSVGSAHQTLVGSRKDSVTAELFNGRLQIGFETSDVQQFAAISSQVVPSDGNWHFVVMSAKAGRVIFSLDGALDPFPTQTWSGDLDWSWRNNIFYLMRTSISTGLPKFSGTIRAIALDNSFVDLETDAGYAQFYTNAGTPRDPGSDGSIWFGGTAPGLFMRGDAATFPTNAGTLANMTLSGTLVTDTGGDVTAPTIASSVPADDATSVATGVDPAITFSENVAFGTGLITLYDVTAGSVLETFDVATDVGTSPGQVNIVDDVLTIYPTTDMGNSNEYAIQIAATAIEDTSGNSFAGITDTTTLSFTTAAAAGLTSLTLVGSSSNGATTSTVPAGVQAGDIIVAFSAADDAAGAMLSPSGYLQGASGVTLSRYRKIVAKVADGTEGGSTVETVSGGGTDRCSGVIVLRGNTAASSASIFASAVDFDTRAFLDTMTISGATKPLVLVAMAICSDPTSAITGRHSYDGKTPDVSIEDSSGPSGRGAHFYASTYSGEDTLTDADISWDSVTAPSNYLPWIALEVA